MARLPANNTVTLFIDYRTQLNGVEHTMQVRPLSGDGGDITAAQQTVLDMLNALGPTFLRTGWRVLSVRGRQANSSVTAPVPILPALQAFAGTNNNSYSDDREAVEMRFVGRSLTTGTRVGLSIFGIAGNIPVGRFRITAATPTWGASVVNAAAALNAGATNARTIDGTIPLWYSYANINYNSYWERRIRTGA